MMYVVVARFVANEGDGDRVAQLLQEMTPLSLSEPGCRNYIVNRALENPNLFLLYEQYDDEAAFTFHTQTEMFNEIILGKVVPLLASRGREIFQVVAG